MSRLNLGDSLILDTDYSTSEVKTGATWIDGKPIYRKVFTGTSPSANGYFTSNTGITNGDTCINVYGVIKGDYWLPIPYTDSSNTCGVVLNPTLTVLNYYFNIIAGYMNKPMYTIIYYTKTTD